MTIPNAIYLAYRTVLDQALGVYDLNPSELARYYVFKRFEYANPRFVSERQIDISLRAKADPVLMKAFDLPDIFGPQEIDFLSLLLRRTRGKVIRLVGNVGTGKSTLLQYMLDCYLPTQNAFRDGLMVLVDAAELLLTQATYDYATFVRRIISALWENLRASRKLSFADPALDDLLAGSGSPNGWWIHRSEIFVEKLVECLRKEVKSRQENCVILAFDNVDIVTADVQQHLARFTEELAAAVRCTVVVALRPPNVRNFGYPSEGQRIRPDDLWQRPPLLREVLSNRLRMVLDGRDNLRVPRPISLRGRNATMTFSHIERFIHNVITVVLTDSVVSTLEQLTNYNVRHALDLMHHFLMSWNLDIDVLLGPVFHLEVTGESPKRPDMTDDLIVALCLRNHRLYSSKWSDLDNLFVIVNTDLQTHQLLKIRLLKKCLASSDGCVLGSLVAHLKRFGYHEDAIVRAIEQLSVQNWRLITLEKKANAQDGNRRVDGSPDGVSHNLADIVASAAAASLTVTITDAGIYYVEQLLRRINYIQLVADELPLPATISMAGQTIYDRLKGFLRFVTYLSDRELAELEKFINSGSDPTSAYSEIEHVYGETIVTVDLYESFMANLERLHRTHHMADVDTYNKLMETAAELRSSVLTKYHSLVRRATYHG